MQPRRQAIITGDPDLDRELLELGRIVQEIRRDRIKVCPTPSTIHRRGIDG
jgi:hypothetical protein